MRAELEAKLPKYCIVFVEGMEPGRRIGIIKRGEKGYYETDWDSPNREDDALVREAVKSMNEQRGVTPAQALAMKIGSMFGWHVPAADPDQHKDVS